MVYRICRNRTLLRAVFVLTLAALCSALASAAEPATAWLKIAPQNSPSPRAAGAVAYDPVSKKVVLFGGFDANGHLDDTWTFDGTNWTLVATPVAPSARSNSGMAFDHATKKLVLFGGFDGANYLNETWVWDGATSTWTQVFPKTSPAPATGPSLFTDPLNGHVDTFGGFNNIKDGYQSTTWQWRGSNWHQIQTATSPSGRGSAETVYDPAHKNVVLYGGISDLNPNNTWIFDGSNWTEQFPATSPDAIMFGGGGFDPVLGQVVLFGGWGGAKATDLNSTWAWDGTSWTQLVPRSSPSPREYLQMAYDDSTHQLIVFGGYQVKPNVLLNDTWKLVTKP
jgi:hypothetical protein